MLQPKNICSSGRYMELCSRRGKRMTTTDIIKCNRIIFCEKQVKIRLGIVCVDSDYFKYLVPLPERIRK